MIFAGILVLAAGAIIAGVMIGCAFGAIRVNSFAGIRIESLMVNEATWRAGHRAALPPTLVGAGVAAALAIASLFPIGVDTAPVLILVAVFAILASIVISAVLAHRAAVEELAEEKRE